MAEKTLAKLVSKEDLVKFQETDKFLEFINQEPPSAWLEKHPLAANVKYLPIDKVELMLTEIFQEWKVEILREGQMLNSIYTTIRLHYKHPINGWTYQDGVAAVPIKTDKGANASDMGAIKNDAIQTGLPAAESFALKDAADKIGNIFGRNINRKNTEIFTPSYADGMDYESLIKNAKSVEKLMAIFNKMNPDEKKEYTDMLTERKKEVINATT
ncbi:MAG: hypothetical protein JWR59_2507 [Brevundimonas sp.]|nr:hypothetical protein [Brevundimonas sp.]